MHHILPDEHPGRCLNIRHHFGADGAPHMLRCLEAEGSRHVCRFPAPPPPVPVTHSHNIYDWRGTAKKPEPWVVPDAQTS